LERVKGIEPSSSAWKAVALPLSYTRIPPPALVSSARYRYVKAGVPIEAARAAKIGGGGWIRTNVGVANGFTVRPL